MMDLATTTCQEPNESSDKPVVLSRIYVQGEAGDKSSDELSRVRRAVSRVIREEAEAQIRNLFPTSLEPING